MGRDGLRLFIVGCLFSSVLWGDDISPKKVIQNVEKRLTSAKTIEVDFQETLLGCR